MLLHSKSSGTLWLGRVFRCFLGSDGTAALPLNQLMWQGEDGLRLGAAAFQEIHDGDMGDLLVGLADGG